MSIALSFAVQFKGFKDGGKLPPRPPRLEEIHADSGLIAKQPAPPQTPVARTAEPAPVVVTQTRDSLIVLSEVLFEVNSYKLKPEIFPQLDSLVEFLLANPSTRIEISGHTDSTGKESHNLGLSENRADAVAEYVVDKGVPTSRVTFNGYGSSRPISTNDTEEGRRKNRRVEILIHNRN